MSLIYDGGMERLWKAVMINALKEGLHVNGTNWSTENKEAYGKHSSVKINKMGGLDITDARCYIYTRDFKELAHTIGLNVAYIKTAYTRLLESTLQAEVEPTAVALDKVKTAIGLFKINKYTFR